MNSAKKWKNRASTFLNKHPQLMWIRKKVDFEINLKSKLKKQLEFKSNITLPLNLYSKKILIPLIETSHYQYLQILIVAKALQLRGADVKVLFCGSRLDGCEIKNSRTQSKDPCLNCRFNAKEVVPLFQLDTLYLGDFISDSEVKSLRTSALRIANSYPEKYIHDGIDLIPIVNDSVTRFFYGKLHEDTQTLMSCRVQHLTSAMISCEVAKKINKSFCPDIIFNNMNVYTAWEPYYRYFQKEQKSLFICSINPFNYHAITLNSMELYMSDSRYEKFKKNRGSSYLNDDEKDELIKFVNNRTSFKTDIFKDLNCFQDNQDIGAKLSIDPNKKNLFLFSNIYWDVGLSETGKLFSSVIEWALETIDLIKDDDTCHLYIKTHPGERYDSSPSSKGIDDFIYEKYPVLPKNVTLILPEYKIIPYQLFPHVDLGIVFNGTIGLEMLLHNIPVVTTGLSPYGGIGLVHEPESLEEYKNILLGKVLPLKPSIDEVNLFAYFYFIKSLIPWTLTRQAYSDNFKGFTFDSLDDIMQGKDKYLDHICNCILDPENTIIEGWE